MDEIQRRPHRTIVDVFGDDMALDAAIEKFTTALNSIPEEYRGTARVTLQTEYDSDDAFAEIYYYRPETDAELQERKLASAEFRRNRDAKERRMYESLKKKFGD